ncbi:hypothetical protein [Streptomyces chilikensis]|uniref:hypothetical protein n=1 Tax=Streptomyces chilikensis TaxID=1194079 RepID=UPI00140918A8|nr:hypothetical protein [Streptomyces chilikensis]
MPRKERTSRRLVADGRTYLWRHRHSHRRPDGGRAVDCRQVLTLSTLPTRPATAGGRLRIVFADGPGRLVPGGAYTGSGHVGLVAGAVLNLHEPGAVRALLDVALARGWQPDVPGEVEVDGWSLLDEAAAGRGGGAGAADA